MNTEISAQPVSRRLGDFDLTFLVGCFALIWGVVAAWRRQWVSDDAFISFRYAENFVLGHGLVYNVGERVEGYSNFLWTAWMAAGLRCGLDIEQWSIVWSIFFYAATLVALWLNAKAAAREVNLSLFPVLPVAAVLAALHQDWNVFATSGLETSLFTFLLVVGYILAVTENPALSRMISLGLVMALASLTRPDGPLVAALCGVFLAACNRQRWRDCAAYAGAFLALWLPFTMWRVGYYGDFFPNTYHAKSGELSWFSQGFIYFSLYCRQYWTVLISVIAAVAALLRIVRLPRPEAELIPWTLWQRRVVLAAMFALGYTFYVLKVGGDFMFARFLIPATPFYFLLLEQSSLVLPVRWPFLAVLGLAQLLTPPPVLADGIVHEWAYYTRESGANARAEGMVLRPLFKDLPVKVAFVGSQARTIYYARPEIAIESITGLTDKFIANQTITTRGRPGHEKLAPFNYLIDKRSVNFIVTSSALNRYIEGWFQRKELQRYSDALPVYEMTMGQVRMRILTWDPKLMEKLRSRGADVPHFETDLDAIIAKLPSMSKVEIQRSYRKMRRFYFQHVHDARREAAFTSRL